MFRRLFRAFRFLFIFRKPVFLELEFIDLIVGEKPLFVAAWKLKDATKISFQPLRHKERKCDGAILIYLPRGLSYVEITASNFWRTARKKIVLRHLHLDSQAAQVLIQSFRPLSRVTVWQTVIVGNTIVTRQTTPHFKQPSILVKPTQLHLLKKMVLKSETLHYS